MLRGEKLETVCIVVALLVLSIGPVVHIIQFIDNMLIGMERKGNLIELINPISEVVCDIRDEIFPNKKGNYTIGDSDSVRDYVNSHIKYSEDWFTWNASEYYATPEETIEKGRGDCEDFAILTCSILRSMNLDAWVVFGERYFWERHLWVRVFDGDESFDYFSIENLTDLYMFNEERIVSLN